MELNVIQQQQKKQQKPEYIGVVSTGLGPSFDPPVQVPNPVLTLILGKCRLNPQRDNHYIPIRIAKQNQTKTFCQY